MVYWTWIYKWRSYVRQSRQGSLLGTAFLLQFILMSTERIRIMSVLWEWLCQLVDDMKVTKLWLLLSQCELQKCEKIQAELNCWFCYYKCHVSLSAKHGGQRSVHHLPSVQDSNVAINKKFGMCGQYWKVKIFFLCQIYANWLFHFAHMGQ